MKKILISLVVMSFVCAGAAQAAPVAVENYSFELPGTEKMENWEDVPGWSSDTVAGDSGVELGGVGLSDGDWQGFLMQTDPSVWNLTDHVIVAGEIFTLSVNASTGKAGGVDFEMTLYYDVAGTRMVGASQVVLAPKGSVPTFDLLFDVDADMPAAVGHKIGIELNDVGSSGANSWMGMDNVRLDVIPEPATMTLLGLGSLALLKRRRA